MTSLLTLINTLFFTGFSLFFILLGICSFVEKEIRATWIALAFLISATLFWGFFILNPKMLPGLNLAVVSGISLYIPEDPVRFSPLAFMDWLGTHRITSVYIPPLHAL